MSDPGPQPQPPPAATPTSTTSTTPAPWFADWKFFVSGQIQETVLSILEKGGAVQKSYLTPGVTHCLVGGEADLDGEVSEAADIYENSGFESRLCAGHASDGSVAASTAL
jgi:hypothetical protein